MKKKGITLESYCSYLTYFDLTPLQYCEVAYYYWKGYVGKYHTDFLPGWEGLLIGRRFLKSTSSYMYSTYHRLPEVDIAGKTYLKHHEA